MTRVFTFGCSFTKYVWPTWADLLAVSPNLTVQNWAATGHGNEFIQKRVIECDSINKFTPDDVVIILWTEHLRFDLLDSEYNWRSERVFDSDNWSEQSGYFNSITSILATIAFLKSTGVKFFLSSIIPLELNEKELFNNLKEESLYDSFPELDIFKDFTKTTNNWIPGFEGDVFEFFHNSKEKYKVFIDDEYFTEKYKRNVVVDRHFIPDNHFVWLQKSQLLDVLGLQKDDITLLKNTATKYTNELMGFESFLEILTHFRPLQKQFTSVSKIYEPTFY